MLGLVDDKSLLGSTPPQFHDRGSYFTMSGTSQAAAVVSDIAALMFQRNPSLTPDEVKCRLMASARPAVDPSGHRAYSIFQQGPDWSTPTRRRTTRPPAARNWAWT